MAKLPLEGVRVVDLTLIWAGPYAAMILADWGAEVIRVESLQYFPQSTRGYIPKPSRQIVRNIGGIANAYPNWDPGDRPWNRHPLFHSQGRNKLSMTADLTRPEGMDILLRLIKVSDVFIENNIPSTIDKLGLGYENLKAVNPQIIMVRMPAFGLTGPYSRYKALGMQMEGTIGHSWIRGYEDSAPSERGDVVPSDAASGASAAFATAMALRHRRRTGKGQLIELATAENFIPFLARPIMDNVMNGRVQGPGGNRDTAMAPHGCYPCNGEDEWVVLAVGSDEEWRGLCRAMGNPAWTQDERFADSLSRWHCQDDLDFLISMWTREFTGNQIMELCQGEGVAAGQVMNELELLRDPHMRARGFFQKLNQVDTGEYYYAGPMWRTDNTINPLRTPPPLLGEHNEYVYKGLLGVSEEEYTRLIEERHVGTEYTEDVLRS